MNKEISEASFKLKKALDELEEVYEIKTKEERMEKDEEVMILSYRFDCAQNAYNEALKFFKEDSSEVKEAQNKLYLAKKELDEHPLVRDYLASYSEIRKKYLEIQHLIFDKFNKHTCQ